MWVKICANTNLEDALAAAEFGADAVGFVFAPSAWQVTAEQVRAISDRLPSGVERVGVFAGIAAEVIAEAAEKARLTCVQLHGPFDAARSRRLEELLGPAISLIPTIAWDVSWKAPFPEVASQLDRVVEQAEGGRVLVDTQVKGVTGGTGVTFDWQAAEVLLSRYRALGMSVVLAGGLRPDNVAEAIRTLKPSGVDVASGVESSPGKKDLQKLRAFIENARGA